MANRTRRSLRLKPGERLGCVLDIETVPDGDVVSLAPRGAVAGRSKRALHRAVCATLLTFAEGREHGELRCLDMHTFTLERLEEGELLGGIDSCLPNPHDGSILVTYAGAMHDLVVLKQRAMRLWMFDMPQLRGWSERHPHHYDLLYSFGSRPAYSSLAEVMALIGADLAGSRPADPASRSIERGDWAPIIRRNRNDVCATFMAYAYWSAWQRGCEYPVATAWGELSAFIRSLGDRGHDMHAFSRHHMVDFASRRLPVLGAERTCRCSAAGTAL